MIINRNLALSVKDDLTFELQLADDNSLLARGQVALGPHHWHSTIQCAAESISTDLGKAAQLTVNAGNLAQTLRATFTVEAYAQWPDALILQWQFENLSAEPIHIEQLTLPQLDLTAWTGERWSFQGAAVSWGQDFAGPLPRHFKRDNFLGHRHSTEGGGLPLVYVWDTHQGLALMHIEQHPQEWHMPVQARENQITLALEDRRPGTIAPGGTLHGLRTLLSLHHGDFFEPLALYRAVMAELGLHAAEPTEECYEPVWCSWGYEFDVRPSEITGVMPKTTELGLRWLTLDDRWFDRYSDWNPRTDTFPGGEPQLRHMVDDLHAAGACAQIWWYPLAVENQFSHWENYPHELSEILRQHPDWLILNEDGTEATNNRHLSILCPALPGVQEHIRETTLRFIHEWDFDGHKLDNIYTVPPCYNPAHHHARPSESVEALAEIYRIIFETTRRLKPASVTQICPCGAPITFNLLPYLDQAVTADPHNSAQVRQRIKVYKALLGPRAAVFADHVELSDDSADFASSIGPGGVPGTKFVWPPDPEVRARLNDWWELTPERESQLKQWLALYRDHRPADGDYLNLYDLAYDRPEAHAIRKGERLYYAFYAGRADESYTGGITLRGLESQTYQLEDYVHDIPFGTIEGPEATLEVSFKGALLLAASPKR